MVMFADLLDSLLIKRPRVPSKIGNFVCSFDAGGKVIVGCTAAFYAASVELRYPCGMGLNFRVVNAGLESNDVLSRDGLDGRVRDLLCGTEYCRQKQGEQRENAFEESHVERVAAERGELSMLDLNA